MTDSTSPPSPVDSGVPATAGEVFRPACRSCGERPARSRGVCSGCAKAIAEGRRPDVRRPYTSPAGTGGVRSPEATSARIARTLARYPHLAHPGLYADKDTP